VELLIYLICGVLTATAYAGTEKHPDGTAAVMFMLIWPVVWMMAAMAGVGYVLLKLANIIRKRNGLGPL
jgi:hypothetical protein